MKIQKKGLVLSIAVSLAIGGCQSPERVIGPEGPEYTDADHASGQWKILTIAYGNAYEVAKNKAGVAPTAEERLMYRELSREGFGMIDLNCSDFFSTAGDHEKWIVFSRDMVGTIGTIATGAIALMGGGSVATAVSALTTATLYGGLDVYTRNFLFNAENVSSVRRLILDVLKADAETRFKLVGDDWTFEKSVEAMQEHQELCRPSSIVAKVKEAIQAGKAVAATDPAKSEAAIADKIANAGLAQTLHATPTEYEKGMLYWYLNKQTDKETAFIKAGLTRLGSVGSGPYLADGKNNPYWEVSDEKALRVFFGQLSPASIAVLEKKIAEWRKQAGEAEAAAGDDATVKNALPGDEAEGVQALPDVVVETPDTVTSERYNIVIE